VGGGGGGHPIRKTGQKPWHSVYSVCFFLLNSISSIRYSIRQRSVCLRFNVSRSEAWSSFLEETQGKEVRH